MSGQGYLYGKRWRLDRARGIARLIDVDEVRTHVCQLLLDGASVRGIAEVAGVSCTAVCSIRNGRQAKIRRDIAARLLTVTMGTIKARTNPAGFVPALGARRRIQAMLALGWRHQDITAAAAGSSAASAVTLHQAGDWIARTTHDGILAAYDALAMTPGPSRRTRDRAAASGYAPPLAWDDDAIDDPLARPDMGHAERRPRGLPAEHLVEDVAWLTETGSTIDAIAAQLHITVAAIEKAHQRAGVPLPASLLRSA